MAHANSLSAPSFACIGVALLALWATESHAAKTQQQAVAAPAWSPAQATGAPNAKQGADDPKAWATALADGGAEWILASFSQPVRADSIRIVESLNPGAIVRVVALADNGDEVEVWRGADSVKAPGGTLNVRLSKAIEVKSVRVELDTTRVAGWNEIDAIGLGLANRPITWADSATASSFYGASNSPFARLLGQEVTVVFDAKLQLRGRVTAVDPQTLTLVKRTKRGHREFLILRERVLYIEVTP